nr:MULTISPECIES: LytR C-terminal domain-containing protein [unclassified Schaalia]
MAVALVLSFLVLKGWIPLPFGQSFHAKVKYASVGDVPCLAEDVQPLAPEQVYVQVLNTTARPGIAGEATEMLKSAGYTTEDPANSNVEFPGKVRISAGPRGIEAAYTVARYFTDAHVVLSGRADNLVLVELGTFYSGRLSESDFAVVKESQSPLKAPKGCLPVDKKAIEKAQSELAGQSEQESGAAQSGETGENESAEGQPAEGETGAEAGE